MREEIEKCNEILNVRKEHRKECKNVGKKETQT